MNIEEKKFLAQWMGWDVKYEYDYQANRAKVYIDEKRAFRLFEWNPDTDHKQFAEVWMKLGERKRIHVISYFNGFRDPQNWTVVLLHNLPKVIQAVLEVIKEGK